MRYLLWAVKLGLFLLVFSFAVKNTDTVAVRYYLGIEWLAPLIFVMLVSFCAGVGFGVVACLGQLFRQRGEIARLRAAEGAGPAAKSAATARG
jgi:uncharacterized integral membrane protein